MHAGRLLEVLNEPAPLTGDTGQAGLRVDGNREADGLQHRKVAGRICVGHRLAQVQIVSYGVVDEGLVAGLAGRWNGGQLAVVFSIHHAQLGTDNVVEERTERLDDEVQGTGDEQCAVAQSPVLAHPTDGRRK